MRHLAWMLAVLTGCEGVVTVVQTVDITGTIASADGHDGPVGQPFTRSYAPKRTFAQNPAVRRVVAPASEQDGPVRGFREAAAAVRAPQLRGR